jgi:hypothetical protein
VGQQDWEERILPVLLFKHTQKADQVKQQLPKVAPPLFWEMKISLLILGNENIPAVSPDILRIFSLSLSLSLSLCLSFWMKDHKCFKVGK